MNKKVISKTKLIFVLVFMLSANISSEIVGYKQVRFAKRNVNVLLLYIILLYVRVWSVKTSNGDILILKHLFPIFSCCPRWYCLLNIELRDWLSLGLLYNLIGGNRFILNFLLRLVFMLGLICDEFVFFDNLKTKII